ncbi:MAG TPA: hypothetical protein VED40_01885 [Azospirillaceae bacterium]|nr:hypothetical protein [Azospirillaceae bacterium]
MTRRLTSFQQGRPVVGTRPAAAGASADAESGTEGLGASDDRSRSLYALKVMFERGLIPREEYEKRRAVLESGE